MHQAAVARKVQAGRLYAHFLPGLAGGRSRRRFLRRGRGWLREPQTHFVQQPKRAFLRLVFQTDGVATSVGKSEGYPFVGLRGARRQIKGDTTSLDVRGERFGE